MNKHKNFNGPFVNVSVPLKIGSEPCPDHHWRVGARHWRAASVAGHQLRPAQQPWALHSQNWSIRQVRQEGRLSHRPRTAHRIRDLVTSWALTKLLLWNFCSFLLHWDFFSIFVPRFEYKYSFFKHCSCYKWLKESTVCSWAFNIFFCWKGEIFGWHPLFFPNFLGTSSVVTC